VVTAAAFAIALEANVNGVLFADSDDAGIAVLYGVAEITAECWLGVLGVVAAVAALSREVIAGVAGIGGVTGIAEEVEAPLALVLIEAVITAVLAPPEAVTMPRRWPAINVDRADDS
jgi:hypothetical protein